MRLCIEVKSLIKKPRRIKCILVRDFGFKLAFVMVKVCIFSEFSF